MAWRHYQIVADGGEFRVPLGVEVVGIAAVGPGGRCVYEHGGLGGGGGGGFAYGLCTVQGGETLTGFVVDGDGSRFGSVLDARAGGDSESRLGGQGGQGYVALPDASAAPVGSRRWLAGAVATGGHGGVGLRADPWVSYGGGGGMGSFYGVGGNGGDGRLVGEASMFGHGGGGGLGGNGGDSLAFRAVGFLDRWVSQVAKAEEAEAWIKKQTSSGPGGGGGGGVFAGGAAWGDYGYLQPKRHHESLGGPGGGGGSFGPGDTGGVLYRPFMKDEAQQGQLLGRLLGTETPGKGGVGTRAVGGVPRFYLSLSGYLENLGLATTPKPVQKPAQAQKRVRGIARCQSVVEVGDEAGKVLAPAIFFASCSGEGRTAMSPYLALASRRLDGGGGTGANLGGGGNGGPGGGGGGAGRLPGFDHEQGRGGLAHQRKVKCIEGLPAGDGGVGGGGGGGGYYGEDRVVLWGSGMGGPGGGGGGGPAARGGVGFFIVYW
ncbi:MAG: hypothetical protein AB2565_03925 [Candidatus Thiodiazotropha endolucinida]